MRVEQFVKWFRTLAIAIALDGASTARPAQGDSFDEYDLVEAFLLPAGTSAFDVLLDQRVIAIANADILIETGAGSRSFSSIGTLPGADIAEFGAAFLRVSPDGSRIAVGNNGGSSFSNYRVGIFSVDALSGVWLAANHFDGEWYDDRFLALTAGVFGDPSFVTLLDTQSADIDDPVNTVLIMNIGGASAGVTFDRAGNLLTGNGFDGPGVSETGWVKTFSDATWLPVLFGASPLDFESQGVLVVDILSAASLGFDMDGNFYVGGGDFLGGKTDFAALVRSTAVASAIDGMGAVDVADPAEVRNLDPDAAGSSNFYAISADPTRSVLYIGDTTTGTVGVYAAAASAPALGSFQFVAVAALLGGAGIMVIRRSPRFRSY